MTDITLEQRALEMAIEAAEHTGNPRVSIHLTRAKRILAALRLSAGADSARLDALEALVDSQPDKTLLLHHGIHIIRDGERRYSGLGLSNTRRTLRQAIDGACMLAAAPRHETGEEG